MPFRLFLSGAIIALLCAGLVTPNLTGGDDISKARQQIKEIKDGALLIRLTSSRNKINAMKKVGLHTKAAETLAVQLAENRSIITAFESKFDFCPVYFFLDTNSREVLAGGEIPVLEKDGNGQRMMQFENAFYIAEFTHIEQDTARYFDRAEHVQDSTGAFVERKVYHGSTSFGFGALIIKSDEFVQLRKPFPFYMRTLETLPIFRRSHQQVVELMNAKLHSYYKREWGS